MAQLRLLPLLFILFTGATYYVDPAGNDSNDGSSGSPFLTIQAGVDAATTAGDTVCVNEGNYTAGFLAGTYSGSDGNPITITNCDGGDVWIDPSEHITSWTDLGGNVYESNTLTETSPVEFWKDTTWLNDAETNCVDVDAEDEWCDNGSTIKIYTTSDPDDSVYRILVTNPIQIRAVSYIVVDGINCMYGRFCSQIGYSFTAPQGATSNITIKNAEFMYTGARGIRVIGTNAEPTTYTYIDNMKIHGARDTGSDNGHCIKFDSNEVGIHNQYGYVTNSEIYDCWYHGIQMSNGWKYGIFDGNKIYNISVKGDGSAAAVRCGGDGDGDCSILNSELGISSGDTDLGSGIYVQDGVGNVTIKGNKIRDFSFYGVYFWNLGGNPKPVGGNIINNYIGECVRGCVYLASSSGVVGIYNNTFTGYNPINILGANEVSAVIKNNSCNGANRDCLTISTTAPEPDSDYNNFYASSDGTPIRWHSTDMTLAEYQTETGNDLNSIGADALYFGNANYQLTSSSPNINAGADLSATFTTDINGNTRGSQFDIGAYEYFPQNFNLQDMTPEGVTFS